MTRDWRRVGLFLAPLGLGGCRTTESYTAGHPDHAWPAASFLADRAAVQNPLRQQAANGAVADSTLFNHFFELDTLETVVVDGIPTFRPRGYPAPTARLSPWGRAKLDRLARHAPGPELCVFVQTARDLPPGPAAAAARARLDLDARRLKEVREYLAIARPDLAATVDVIDLDSPGMTGPEARIGYNRLLSAPTGSLPPEAILGASIGSGGALGGGGGGAGPQPGSLTPLAPADGGGGSPGAAGGGLSPSAPGPSADPAPAPAPVPPPDPAPPGM